VWTLIRIFKHLPTIVIVFLIISCSSEQSYDSLVKEGLSSGIVADSLFLGYHFGMSIEEFHSSSMEMNRRGEITGYTKVVYRLESLPYPAIMEFYPIFLDGVIEEIPVTISYEGWAPWNEHLFSNELIEDIKEYYIEIYDAEFINIFVPELNSEAYVDIQGNREIRIYQDSPSTVMVHFIDLSVNQ